MLKLAGVKSEKEFYKKYPTEEAFMKAHGKEFKKAQTGIEQWGLKGLPKYNASAPKFMQPVEFGGTPSLNYTPQGLPSLESQVSPTAYDITGMTPQETKNVGKFNFGALGGTPLAKTIQNVGAVVDAFKQRKEAKKFLDISKIVKQAASQTPDLAKRQYVRPEDNPIEADQMGVMPYGGGYDVLGMAKNGAEIQNTYSPGTLYDNLGYEPLDESSRLKQFEEGGYIQDAQTGTMIDAGMQVLDLGLGLQRAIPEYFIGRDTKKYMEQGLQNMEQGAMNQALASQFGSFMKDGGTVNIDDEYKWVSNSWQPQVITTFGEHKLKDLLKSPKDADMLRAGGHLKDYTPPSARAMSTERPMMQEGGELQTHWGGYAEPMSYNPYLPEDGETIMFKGQSHEESDGKGNTGIGVTFGNSPVEVERNEPAMKMKDGSGGDSSLVVFGNLKVPKGMLPGADGLNFKKYVADLSKNENKINQKVNSAVNKLDELDVITPYDQLAFNTLKAQIDGGNQKLKDIAQNKMDAAALQTAMNDTVEEFGLQATDKGTIMAREGAFISKAQAGTKKPKRATALAEVPKGQRQTNIAYGNVTLDDIETLKKNNPWYDWTNFNPKNKADVLKFQKAFDKLAKETNSNVQLLEDRKLGEQTASAAVEYEDGTSGIPDFPLVTTIGTTTIKPGDNIKIPQYGTSKISDLISQVLPYIRPSDVEELDPNQLRGEMFALSTNQLQPVQAQKFQPQLSTPYNVSLQDVLNENEATFRSQQRIVGYNPALQNQLAAQKYAANQKVLGEQFRINQAVRDQISRENRDLLNKTQLQNLEILDKQYVRQSEAMSKTKATTQAALNSIASKYAQNKLQNRELQVYENMYNYRYSPNFRTQNFQLGQFNIPTIYTGDSEQPSLATPPLVPKKKGKNGSIVKALKNL